MPLERQQTPSPTFWSGGAWIVLLMIVVIAVRMHELVPALELVSPVLLVSVGGLFLIFARSSSEVRALAFSPMFTRLVLAFFLFSVATAPFALWAKLAAETLQTFLPVVLLVIAVGLCATTRRSQLILQWGFTATVAVYGLYMVKTADYQLTGRIAITTVSMYDANDLASLAVICCPLAAGLFLRTRRWYRFFALAIIGALILLLTASQSRGGTVGLAVASLIFALGMKGYKRWVGLIGVAIAAALFWSISSPEFRDRIKTITQLDEDYNSISYEGRKNIWKRGLTYFVESPLIGVGSGNFSEAEGQSLRKRSSRGKWSAAHNTYLQVIVESGVLGGVLFLWVLLYALRGAYRLWKGIKLGRTMSHHPEFFAALVGVLTSATFLSHAHYPPLYALLALTVLAERIARREVLEARVWLDSQRQGAEVFPARRLTQTRRNYRGNR